MNFNTDQWPDLLTNLIGESLDVLLFGWLIVFLVCVFSIIMTVFQLDIFSDTMAKNFPYAVSILDTMIWAMRAMSFGMLGLLSFYYMWGDDQTYFMFVFFPQLLMMVCIVFLFTEMLRISLYGQRYHGTFSYTQKR